MRNIDRTDWKVYTPAGEFTAATKCATEAAALIAFLGEGAQIKYMHHTLVWTEGKEKQPAAESYDYVTDTCIDRVNETRRFAIALDELRRRAVSALDARDVSIIGMDVAQLNRVDQGKLLEEYTKQERARERKRTRKTSHTNERLSRTLKIMIGGNDNGKR